MPESLSSVYSVLWRIAELGARCGQRSGPGDRRQMWEKLERLIAEVGAELSAARREGETLRDKALAQAQAAQRADRAWRTQLRKVEAARADAETRLTTSVTEGEAVVRLLAARASGESVAPVEDPAV
jgi:hypothetical protein